MRFFESLDLPTHTTSQQASLDKSITLDEISTAIHLLPSNKTLGIEWYQTHLEELAPRLLRMFQVSLELGMLPDSMNEALIVVIIKPGKDRLHCGSYRPISLLNNDAKILAKVLALRLQMIILSLI